MEDKQLSERESLELITSMINRAKNSYHDSGVSPILWGMVISVCSLVQLAQIRYNFKLPFDIYWLTLVAIIPQIILSVRERRRRQARSHNDVVMDYLWLAFGICIFLLGYSNASLFGVVNDLKATYFERTGEHSTLLLSDHIFSSYLILYGLPTFVTGAIMNFKPMLLGGIVCWICSAICVRTSIQVDLLLVTLSAMCAWLIPGLILRQRFLHHKRSLPSQDV